MSDEITITYEKPKYAIHPAEVSIGVCVDVIDLGEKVEQYQQQPPKIVRKLAIVFQSEHINPDTGKPFELSVERTVSFGKKAGLRKFLQDWRGKAYTEAEAEAGIPLHKLVGHCASLTVEHKESQSTDRTYANVTNVAPVHKSAVKPKPDRYERSEHWAKRREEYEAGAAKFRAEHQSKRAIDADDSDFPPALNDETDDLPF